MPTALLTTVHSSTLFRTIDWLILLAEQLAVDGVLRQHRDRDLPGSARGLPVVVSETSCSVIGDDRPFLQGPHFWNVLEEIWECREALLVDEFHSRLNGLALNLHRQQSDLPYSGSATAAAVGLSLIDSHTVRL